MKSKYLFLAFAASAALVGCQNEEVLAPNETNATGKAIDASEIRFAVSKDEAATRAVWEGNQLDGYDFYWEKGDQIGVAYIGDAGNEMQSQGVTNYQFKVDSLQLPSFKKKDDSKRWTGYFCVGDNTIGGTETIADVLDGESGLTLYYTDAKGEVLTSLPTSSKNAKFGTPNDYIFEGYYAVYYPFDGSYKKKGYIPVKSPESIVIKSDLTDNLQVVAAHTFSFSKPESFKSSDRVAEFKLQQLSGILQLNLRNKSGEMMPNATLSSNGQPKNVQKILIVPSQEFTVSGKLNNVEATPGENVISDAKTASAMEVKFVAFPTTPAPGDGSSDQPVVAAAETTPTASDISLPVYAANDAETTIPVYIPMLPKSGFTGMDVYLINQNGAAIKVVKTANFDIKSSRVQPVGIDITSSNFNTWIAYDEKSFQAVAKNAQSGSVIELLKPVTLTSDIGVANKVTIQGKSITLKNGALSFSTAGTVVKSDIIANGGSLTPTNATFGKLTVNANKKLTLEASGKFNEIVNNGTLVLGKINTEMSVDVVKVTNNGKLEIKSGAAINPTGSAIDNKGEVYQYVGSVIGAKQLTNAATATYTCEVVNQTKFNEAVARKATKIVLAETALFKIPATGAENIVIQFNAQARLENQSTNSAGVTTYVTGVVKDIISNNTKSGKYGARIDQNLTVKGNITVNKGCDLKVLKNRTVNVTGKIILGKNAEFVREQGGATDIEAKVNCSGIETGDGASWIGGQPNY